MQRRRNGFCGVQALSIFDTDFQVDDMVVVPVIRDINLVLLQLKLLYEQNLYELSTRNCQHFVKEAVEGILSLSRFKMKSLITIF